jgi:hypothetical protein
MSERFAKKWEKSREEDSFSKQIKDTITPPPPLKAALDNACRSKRAFHTKRQSPFRKNR